MPRLADPDPNAFPEDVRELLSTLPPDPMVKMLAHSVGTVKLFVDLARAQFTSLELPARSRELVVLTVAEYAECEFEAAQHRPMALEAGLDQRVIEIISARDLDNPELSPSDRALIRFTAEVVRSPRISDELFDQVRHVLSEREIVEVLQVVGYYWSFSRICTVLDVELTKVYSDERVVSGDAGRAD
ncbi:carboxymuconolactone decarboxylase family protein [Micromonospora sp. B9E7]|uniref:carboxymuconolactone decarboxylase family protein n=1 Tax=Micromonospora sp. B9E7 TaxID=3153574 RepID=UPI00325D6332